MTALFVYGSLARRACLEEVLGHRFEGEQLRAEVLGLARVWLEEWPYPVAVERADARLKGLLLDGLGPDEMWQLDAYEEVGLGLYVRAPVRAIVWGCGAAEWEMAADVYLRGPALADRAIRDEREGGAG